MIHFFPRFGKDAADTPFGAALRASGVPHRIFGADLPLNYRSRADLLLRIYPALIRNSVRCGWRSLLRRGDGPAPDAVVLTSDVEVLVFALLRCLPGAAPARIVLTTFIFTARSSPLLNRLRRAYYRLVMRFVWLAVVHSSMEVARYEEVFAGCGTRFRFVAWGGYVPDPATLGGPAPRDGASRLVVSAGRSGRDYATLAAAARDAGCELVIVCNQDGALGGVEDGPGVRVRRDCFGPDYLRQLLAADVVAVPLAVVDISAGQMVMIEAMALGRPVVITRSPALADYVTDGEDAVLVPRGDVPALAATLRRLLDDKAEAARIGAAARRSYGDRLSVDATVRATLAAIAEELAAGRSRPG